MTNQPTHAKIKMIDEILNNGTHKYSVVYDIGFPVEESADNETELLKILKDIWKRIQNGDDYPIAVKVYNDKDEDITEGVYIETIVNEIMEGKI